MTAPGTLGRPGTTGASGVSGDGSGGCGGRGCGGCGGTGTSGSGGTGGSGGSGGSGGGMSGHSSAVGISLVSTTVVPSTVPLAVAVLWTTVRAQSSPGSSVRREQRYSHASPGSRVPGVASSPLPTSSGGSSHAGSVTSTWSAGNAMLPGLVTTST
jgi:hypothetical protein